LPWALPWDLFSRNWLLAFWLVFLWLISCTETIKADHMEAPEKPPFFRTWSAWYLLLVACLLAEIIFFGWLTNHFS
jgi:hypothetical protein